MTGSPPITSSSRTIRAACLLIPLYRRYGQKKTRTIESSAIDRWHPLVALLRTSGVCFRGYPQDDFDQDDEYLKANQPEDYGDFRTTRNCERKAEQQNKKN